MSRIEILFRLSTDFSWKNGFVCDHEKSVLNLNKISIRDIYNLFFPYQEQVLIVQILPLARRLGGYSFVRS